jgi:hypothetical protein
MAPGILASPGYARPCQHPRSLSAAAIRGGRSQGIGPAKNGTAVLVRQIRNGIVESSIAACQFSDVTGHAPMATPDRSPACVRASAVRPAAPSKPAGSSLDLSPAEIASWSVAPGEDIPSDPRGLPLANISQTIRPWQMRAALDAHAPALPLMASAARSGYVLRPAQLDDPLARLAS